MKLLSFWFALNSADQISFNRLNNNVINHVNLQISTKIANVELKLQLVDYMLKHGHVKNAKSLLNRAKAEKLSQKSQYRLKKYLKY